MKTLNLDFLSGLVKDVLKLCLMLTVLLAELRALKIWFRKWSTDRVLKVSAVLIWLIS